MNKFTRNNQTFNLDNSLQAKKVMPYLVKVQNIGKNALVLKNIAQAVSRSKTNPTYDFFVSDGLESAITKLALGLTSQEMALKASKADNFALYFEAFKKWAKNPNVELDAEQKRLLKVNVIAKARILRDGLFSKYIHDELSLNDLKYHFEAFTAKPKSEIEPSLSDESKPLQTTGEEVEQGTDLSALTATLKGLDLNDALLMMEVLQGHIQGLSQDENKKVA